MHSGRLVWNDHVFFSEPESHLKLSSQYVFQVLTLNWVPLHHFSLKSSVSIFLPLQLSAYLKVEGSVFTCRVLIFSPRFQNVLFVSYNVTDLCFSNSKQRGHISNTKLFLFVDIDDLNRFWGILALQYINILAWRQKQHAH